MLHVVPAAAASWGMERMPTFGDATPSSNMQKDSAVAAWLVRRGPSREDDGATSIDMLLVLYFAA